MPWATTTFLVPSLCIERAHALLDDWTRSPGKLKDALLLLLGPPEPLAYVRPLCGVAHPIIWRDKTMRTRLDDPNSNFLSGALLTSTCASITLQRVTAGLAIFAGPSAGSMSRVGVKTGKAHGEHMVSFPVGP